MLSSPAHDLAGWRQEVDARIAEAKGREWTDRHRGLLDAQADWIGSTFF